MTECVKDMGHVEYMHLLSFTQKSFTGRPSFCQISGDNTLNQRHGVCVRNGC